MFSYISCPRCHAKSLFEIEDEGDVPKLKCPYCCYLIYKPLHIKTRKEDRIEWTPDKSQIATFEKNTIKNSETMEFCAGMVIGSLGVMVLYYLREVVLGLLKV